MRLDVSSRYVLPAGTVSAATLLALSDMQFPYYLRVALFLTATVGTGAVAVVTSGGSLWRRIALSAAAVDAGLALLQLKWIVTKLATTGTLPVPPVTLLYYCTFFAALYGVLALTGGVLAALLEKALRTLGPARATLEQRDAHA